MIDLRKNLNSIIGGYILDGIYTGPSEISLEIEVLTAINEIPTHGEVDYDGFNMVWFLTGVEDSSEKGATITFDVDNS